MTVAVAPMAMGRALHRQRLTWIAIAGATLMISSAASLCLGRKVLGIEEVLRALLDPAQDLGSILVWDLRLPRLILACLVGASLAVAGALMQGVIQNDLAVPELTGVTGGASFAVVAASLWFDVTAGWQPFCGLLGGLAAAGLSLLIAWDDQLRPLRLTLAGIAVGALAVAGTQAALVTGGPQAGSLFFWLVGGLSGRSWLHVSIIWPWLAAGFAIAFLAARNLDLLSLGEDQARSLGVAVARWRALSVIASIALTVATVSVAGPIAFVGLTIPHLARMAAGQQHRWVLPVCALMGATLLAVADLASRFLGGARELPVGMLTALIGGPVLLRMITKRRR
jgi:iron complex transport system permease protein